MLDDERLVDGIVVVRIATPEELAEFMAPPKLRKLPYATTLEDI